jgi:hypothetical protein
MFAYNPTVTDQSGAILAQGQLGAAQADAAMMQQLGRDISKPIRTAGRAAAGFAMGGPAGAAMAVRGGDEGGGGGGGDDSVIGSFVSAYANNKALDAKAAAYGDFLSRHGTQLGFDPAYIKEFANAPRDQQLAAGDMLTGQFGQQVGRMQYLNTQGSIFGGNSGTGAGGKGGAGDYVVGQGWQ